MTSNQVMKLYEQVSDELCDGKEWCWSGAGEPLQRFAALVAAHEREECAKVCEEQYEHYGHDHIFAAKIRARGQS
jgi:hypothetical protein